MRDLRLQHVHDRIVSEIGVGAVEHEEVGEARRRQAQIGRGARTPGPVQVDAVAPGDPHRAEEFGCGEAGAIDQDVEFADLAVAGLDAARGESLNFLRHQLDIGSRHGRQIIVRQQQALAADRIVRAQLGPQRWIAHLACKQFAEGAARGDLHQSFEPREGQSARFVAEIDGQAVPAHRPGTGREPPPFSRGIGAIRFRHHISGGSLKDRHMPHLVGDGGDELDRRGAGADDADTLAFQRYGVGPIRRMERRDRQLGAAGQARDRRSAQLPHGADHQPRAQLAAVRRPDRPAIRPLVERGARHLGAKQHMVADTLRVSAPFQIGVDFRLHREHARPGGVRGEGKGIEMRGHVASRTGVDVVAPNAAYSLRLFKYHEVRDAALLQAMRHADPGETCADDDRI